MENKALRLAISAILAGAVGGTAQVSSAQEGAEQAGLEEIIVTATRREQDLQEVPVSIVAITGDNLELQGLDSLEDVGNYIPNINIQGGGAGTYGTTFRVRGLPNIGMFVDGVWQVNTNGFLIQDLVDVDRIEVLRGPQGTTYGRDAVGGAIRVWTRRPGEEFGGSVTATTGSNDRRDVKLSLDVPLSDNFRTKWTASSLYRGGYIQGLTIDHQFGDIDQNVYRGDMVWTPSDTVDIRLTHSEDEVWFTEPRIQNGIWDTAHIPGPGGDVPAVQTWGVIPAQFYGLAGEGAAKRGVDLGLDPFDAEHFEAGYPGGVVGQWENRSNATLPSHIRRAQTSLDINWDITDSISVQSLSAVTQVRPDINVDWENSDYVLVEDIIRTELDVFSEEIQISGGNDRVSWVAGLYYWDQESVNRRARFTLDEFRALQGEENPELLLSDVYNSDRCLALGPADQGPFAGGGRSPDGFQHCQWVAWFTMNIFAYDRLQFNAQDGWAVFGEATIALTDRLDLTVGLRQHDQSEQSGNLTPIPGVTAPRMKTGNMLHTHGDPFAGTRPTVFGPENNVSFDQDTVKAALQMQFNDDIMGYFSYSEGFDSGGIDSAQVGDAGQNLYFPYDPQIIENTEIGLRADLMDGLLRVNATYFDSDWINIQNAGVVRDPDGNELTSLATQNVGEANASGLELEITVVPTDSLMLNFNLGLLDTGYTYVAPGVPRQDISLDTEFQQAPDLTYNVGIQYDASLSNGGSVTTRVDYAYSDKFWRSLNFLRMDWYGPKNGGPVPAGIDESGDWGVLNARVTYTPGSGSWRMSVFGTNLTNEYMLNSGFFHGIWGYNFATVSRPREAGLSLTVNF
ncbi:TonB-dependent receptor [Candidatus Rariloculus sp.]|uniref:TonB-dependent receptor n=1 Tax=Candidatus Rariloculus sp. TaxID=3101265 RepID=UPI003D0E9044